MTTTAPPATAALARAHYRTQTALARRAADRVQALWGRLDRRDLTGSWQDGIGDQVADAVAAGQLAAAARADGYVTATAQAEGAEPEGGQVNPAAFAGHAADGRRLDSLLYLPVITSKARIAAGQPEVDAMLAGLEQLLRMTATEVADAGRTAVGAAIAGRRTIQGYIRVASAPCCARCAILSGKEFGWNSGFQRHPRCDCYHLPATLIARGGGGRQRPGLPSNAVTDARSYFSGLPRAEQDRIFTRDGARAIRDGADITSVVNARRGMYTASAYGRTLRATRESTTRRGLWFQQEFRRLQREGLIPRGASSRGYTLRTPRLMPEEIYQQAASREEAIRMLHRFGYLT